MRFLQFQDDCARVHLLRRCLSLLSELRAVTQSLHSYSLLFIPLIISSSFFLTLSVFCFPRQPISVSFLLICQSLYLNSPSPLSPVSQSSSFHLDSSSAQFVPPPPPPDPLQRLCYTKTRGTSSYTATQPGIQISAS